MYNRLETNKMELVHGVTFYLERLKENILFLNDIFSNNQMKWTFVLKAFSEYPKNFVNELITLQCQSIASDNLEHLCTFKRSAPNIETWYLNYEGVIINHDWLDVNITHSIESVGDKTCLMLELDEDREGAPWDTYLGTQCSRIGAYLNCQNIPDINYYLKWKALNIPSNIIQSLGTSVSFSSIDLLRDSGVNHYRIGELALTGIDINNGCLVKGMRQDVFTPDKARSYYIISNLY